MRLDLGGPAPRADATARLSDAEARRVLARAAERDVAGLADAGWEAGVTAAQLREAALEAGIAPTAFEAALAEVRAPGPRRVGRSRLWRTAAAAVLAITLAAGVTAVRRRSEPAASGLAERGLAVSGGCDPRVGVPAERARAFALQLHPDAFLSPRRDAGVVIGLLFDAQCRLTAHALDRSMGTAVTTDVALRRLFPGRYGGGQPRYSGLASVETRGTLSVDSPWVMWAVVPPAR